MSPWDGSVSPETESAQIFGKRFRSPIINNINSCSLHEIHAVHGGGGGWGWPWLPCNRKCQRYLKCLRSLPLNIYIPISCVMVHQMVCRSWPLEGGHDPYETVIAKYFENGLESHPKTTYIRVSCVKRHHIIFRSLLYRIIPTSWNRKCPNILRIVNIYF